MIIVLMGVTGAGKTTVGNLLAADLGWEFIDADDYHPPSNVEKMRRGIPLTEADRKPWLSALEGLLRQADVEGKNMVLACSALRAAYRATLAQAAKDVRFVLLHAPAEVIAERLERRRGHYMHPELLHSQLQALEKPPQAVHVDVSGTPAEAVAEAKRLLRL